jgi:hypothetical protein
VLAARAGVVPLCAMAAATGQHEFAAWVVVALLGQVPVRAGQPVHPGWWRMGVRVPGVEIWLVR